MSERSALLKKRMQAGGASVGAWLTLAGLNVAEIMAGAGFDWLIIDTEHAVFDLADLQISLAGFKGGLCVPFVRVAGNDPVRIKHALDVGAEGIVVPQVDSADEARRAVAACKFPPDGIRGYGPRRAANYYRTIDEYVERANRDLFVILQIESLAAAEQIEAILDVPGIDVIFLGPQDMSGSAGVLRQTDHPRVVEALEKIKAACRARGMPICTGAFEPGMAAKRLAEGVNVLLTAFDDTLLRQSAERTAADVRREVEAEKAKKVRG